MKQSCRRIPSSLMTETEISSKKHQASTISVIRLYCIKTFSSGVFFSFNLFTILGDFILKNYEFNLKEQPERAQPYR